MEFGPLATALVVQQYQDLERMRKRYRENEKLQRKLNKTALRYDDFVSAGVEMYMRGLQHESEDYWKKKFEELPRAIQKKPKATRARPFTAVNEERVRRERGLPPSSDITLREFLAGGPTLPQPAPAPAPEVFRSPGHVLGTDQEEIREAIGSHGPFKLRLRPRTPPQTPGEAAERRRAGERLARIVRSPQRAQPRRPTVRRSQRTPQPRAPWTPQ